MKIKFLFPFLIALLPTSVLAAYVAVLETIADKDLLTLQERQYLTDVLRGQAVQTLPAEQNFTIMTRENINVMLPPGKSIEECEGSCLAETGKNIAADYVAQARIGKVGEKMFVSAELYETASGKLVSSFQGRGSNIDELENVVNERAEGFFRKVRSSSGVSQVGDVGKFSLQGKKAFIVSINSNPEGAMLSMDGRPIPKCIQTPCKVQIEAGEHRFVAVLEHYADADSLVKVSENNQEISLNLELNVGTFAYDLQLQQNVGNPSDLKLYIDNEIAESSPVQLDPGIHKGLAVHPCYDPLNFQVGIEANKQESYSNAMTRGIAGLSLSTEKNGEPVVEPVYIDGVEVGSTPYLGEVPLCSEITIGADKVVVPVELRWHETVEYVYEVSKKAPAVVPAPVPYDSVEKELEKDIPPRDSTPVVASKGALAKFRVGLHAAATYNTWWGDGSGDLGGVGVNAGLGTLIPFNDFVALNLGAEYSFRRLAGSQKYEGTNTDVVTTIMAVDIPVLVRAQFNRYGYMNLGPMASVFLNANESVDILGNSLSEGVSEYFKKYEFGVVAGLGVTLYPAGRPLDIDFRFTMGLTDISDSDKVGQDFDCKSMQFALGLTYWFL